MPYLSGMGVEGEIRSEDHLPSAALWHTNYHVSKWHRPVVQDSQQLSIPICDDYCQSVLFSGWVAASGTGMGQRKCLKEGWAWYGMVLKLMQSPIHTNTPKKYHSLARAKSIYLQRVFNVLFFCIIEYDRFWIVSSVELMELIAGAWYYILREERCHGPKLILYSWERAMPLFIGIYIYIYRATPIKRYNNH